MSKKEVQEELQSSRKKKERLERIVQELTKEAGEATDKMDLLVKSNAMRSKARRKKEYSWFAQETEANVKVDLAYFIICLMRGQGKVRDFFGF